MAAPKRVLLISDDTLNRLQSRVEKALAPRDYELMTTSLRGYGLEIAIAEQMPNLVIIDVSLSLLENGLLTGLLIRTISSVPVLLLCAGKDGTVQLVDVHNESCLSTPFDLSRLKELIEDVMLQDMGHAS